MMIFGIERKKSGFTLVEILIVVGLILLLAAMAMPNLIHARTEAKAKVCIRNLIAIDSAKEQFAIQNQLNNGDEIGESAVLDPYIKGGFDGLSCPSGGTYEVGVVGADPVCPINEHAL